jgi:bacterioferritin-associated ferredoxin
VSQSSYSDHVIGPNLNFVIQYQRNLISFEFLINSKSELVDFYVEKIDHPIRDKIIEVLSRLIKTDLNRTLGPNIYTNFEFEEKDLLHQLLEKIYFYLSPVKTSLVQSDDRVCRCFNIGKEEILNLHDNGAHDLLSITNLSRAGGGCTSCLSDIARILNIKDSSREEERGGFKISSHKRVKVMGMWPAEFLRSKIYPLLKETGSKAKVIQLIENHLYVQSNDQEIELENFLKENCPELLLFYV